LRSPWLIAVLLQTASPAAAQTPDQVLPEEIRRVRAEVEQVVPKEQRAALFARLERAAAAAKVGRHYLALYELETPYELAGAFTYALRAAAVTDADRFTRHWKDVREPKGQTGEAGSPPLVIQAISTSAEARGPALHRASLPFSKDAGVVAGLHYLGESQVVGAFAAFARTIRWASAGKAVTLRSIGPELDALDAELTKSYGGMAPAQHSSYVITSVTVKRARGLNDEGRFAGALLQYLIARYQFAAIRNSTPAAVPDASMLEAARRSLPSGFDHSIADLFVQLAEFAVASPDENVRRGAALVTNEVLPAYHAALRPREVPAKTSLAGTDTMATITLVRWPFT
jgi:hypothetical protein